LFENLARKITPTAIARVGGMDETFGVSATEADDCGGKIVGIRRAAPLIGYDFDLRTSGGELQDGVRKALPSSAK
jgi:hypothetical protein